MSYSEIESSLLESTRYFDKVVERRERLIKESRDVISLSSKTIVSLHTCGLKEARALRKEAKKRLAELRKVAGTDLVRYLTIPEQEYVESSVMYALLTKQAIPSLEYLGVLPSSYILGLLDSVGELKRSVYDSIRKGDLKTAEGSFSTMESIFALLSPFAVYDNIVQGVRRKLDVARILIEDTRAIVTEEVRRQEFMQTVERFSRKIGAPPETPLLENRRLRSITKGNSTPSEPIEEYFGSEPAKRH